MESVLDKSLGGPVISKDWQTVVSQDDTTKQLCSRKLQALKRKGFCDFPCCCFPEHVPKFKQWIENQILIEFSSINLQKFLGNDATENHFLLFGIIFRQPSFFILVILKGMSRYLALYRFALHPLYFFVFQF